MVANNRSSDAMFAIYCSSLCATLTHLSWPRSSYIHDSGVTENNMGWREMLSWHNKVIIYNVSSNCQKTLYSHLLTFVLLSCLGNELMIKESKTHRWPRGKNCNVLLYKTPYLKDSPPKSPFCLKLMKVAPNNKPGIVISHMKGLQQQECKFNLFTSFPRLMKL